MFLRSILTSTIAVFVLSGCNSTKFAARSAVLQKSVMGGDAEGTKAEAEGHGLKQPGGESELSEAEGRLNQPDGTNDEVDVRLECGDSPSSRESNFKHAVVVGEPVVLAVDGKICSADPNTLRSLAIKKSITIADAQRLCPSLVPAMGKWASVEIIINGVSYPSKKGILTMLYALNKGTASGEEADEYCDERHSPLVIHVASDVNRPSPIALSPQSEGVFFDLLGARNNHVPVKISWFTNLDYRLLALPDANGQVRSIDELFGNNTPGPDGGYADNGYAALAKFDGASADGMFQLVPPDGYITRADPVFEYLRLWLDENFDGLAQAHELANLDSVDISYIDLNYSSDFAETDSYGNQTKMKSVVGYNDNTLDLIFDLWFF